MKSKKNSSIYIVAAIIFTVLYLFLAAKPLAKEYQYSPEWKINISNPVIKPDAKGKKAYFKLGQSLGYFTENGEISLYKTYPAKSTISDYYYATYNSQASNTPFYNADGFLQGTISLSGFPYFVEDRIYVMLPGGNSFAKCNENGTLDWKIESITPITAFASNKNFTAAGYIDGKIAVFENDSGKNYVSFTPGGSDYSVILGLDISSNGNYIASISGHDQQRFVLAHKEATQTKIIFHDYLQTDTNYRCLVHFCEESSRVIYVYEDNIGIYDYLNDTKSVIPINSQILSIKENDDLVFLLGKKNNTYTVYIIEKTNSLEGSFSFKADSAFIHVQDDNLFVGKDYTISKIKISKE